MGFSPPQLLPPSHVAFGRRLRRQLQVAVESDGLARALRAPYLPAAADEGLSEAEAKLVQPGRRVSHRWRDGGAPARLSPAVSRSSKVRESNRVDAREPDLILCLLASRRRLPVARRPDKEPIAESAGKDDADNKVLHQEHHKVGKVLRSLWLGGQQRSCWSTRRWRVVGGGGAAYFAAAVAGRTNF